MDRVEKATRVKRPLLFNTGTECRWWPGIEKNLEGKQAGEKFSPLNYRPCETLGGVLEKQWQRRFCKHLQGVQVVCRYERSSHTERMGRDK